MPMANREPLLHKQLSRAAVITVSKIPSGPLFVISVGLSGAVRHVNQLKDMHAVGGKVQPILLRFFSGGDN